MPDESRRTASSSRKSGSMHALDTAVVTCTGGAAATPEPKRSGEPKMSLRYRTNPAKITPKSVVSPSNYP